MTKFNKSLTALAIATSLGLAMPAMATNTNGIIKGTVTSATQQTIAGATVTIRNTSTGYTKTVTADENGQYRIPALPVGKYEVTTSMSGYDSETISNINVGLGETLVKSTMFEQGVERIEITGSAISVVDTTSAETALNISADELERVPVPRNVTSVALLAPGTTRGDSRFGGASFGGSSVAENVTYINGLNVTNFRNGLGFSNVPYEFYNQFQVKTGGYSAEFGRSTGGVINAITKSGSNEFAMGGSVYYQPKSMRENSPNSLNNDGTVMVYRADDSRESINANIWASGALVEDKLFYYVIFNPRDISVETDNTKSEGSGSKQVSQTDDAFWGAKLDYNISEDHRLELLMFSDKNTSNSDNYGVDDEGNYFYQSTVVENSGGENWSLKYTGYLTDTLTISAMYGENSYDLTEKPSIADDCELQGDYRTFLGANSDIPVGNLWVNCATNLDFFIEEGDDKREAMRIDFEWAFHDDHLLRFGMDNETNKSNSIARYAGPNGVYQLIRPVNQGTRVNGVLMTSDTEYVQERKYHNGGSFETQASAFYVEDTWMITDSLTATIGLRSESFDNKNAEGNSFVKVDNQIAPRLGLSWDVNGDGESKLFANWGRYFLPVANNTNVRLSGSEADSNRYYYFAGFNDTEYNGIPIKDIILGDEIGSVNVVSDGTVPDTRSIVSANLEPMFQDELIIGYQAMLDESWSYGIKYTNRVMDGAIDDMIIDHAYDCGSDYHPHQYVLGNPGVDMEVYGDSDCDGTPDSWMTFTAEQLQYDKAERRYDSVDLNVEKQWDGVWSVNATYTWSRSRGNTEGMVNSDRGQDDAGITTDWDFPELMDGAYGYLPNDRRHNFKIFGTVAITEGLTFGFNYNLESGRPFNAFGQGHPDIGGEVDYGYTYWLANDTGNLDENGAAIYDWIHVPRGSMGRLDWQSRLDINLMYKTEIMGLDTSFKLDVFNALNSESATRVDEEAEGQFALVNSKSYGRPIAFQTPRYVQLSASFRF